MKTAFLMLACLVVTGPALAQQTGNSLYITQSGNGNQATIDQSAASGSIIGALATPVAQTGGLNQLTITDSGSGNILSSIGQSNTVGGEITGANTAQITLGANTAASQVALSQNATVATGNTFQGANTAAITLLRGTSAVISQEGTGNNAALVVDGTGASGAIVQNGDGNLGLLTIRGGAATLTQNGSGLSSADVTAANVVPARTNFANTSGVIGISVLTNGGTVNITQTGSN